MRNSNLKFSVTAAVLAGSVALFSVFVHGEGTSMMAGHSEHNEMMSSQGMQGMGGMMSMMSDMSPNDRKAMTEACIKMMQGHGGDGMQQDLEDKGTDAK